MKNKNKCKLKLNDYLQLGDEIVGDYKVLINYYHQSQSHHHLPLPLHYYPLNLFKNSLYENQT